jgi:hypothetical protein
MSDNGHDLHDVFPGAEEALHRLKLESRAFRALADRYHALAKAIHRIEAGIDPASDERLDAMKKERLSILDAVAALVAPVAA